MPARVVSPVEYSKTIDECFRNLSGRLADRRQARTKSAVRDAAMISLAYTCGLKTGEIVALDRQDYDIQTRQLSIRGASPRILTIPGFTGSVLDYWCDNYVGFVGPMFYGVSKYNRRPPIRLSTRTLQDDVSGRFVGAGVGPRSPGDLRRSFKSLLVQAGTVPKVSRALLGQASRVVGSGSQASQAEMDDALVAVSLLAPAYVVLGRTAIGP